MAQVTFTGKIVIPETNLQTFEVSPDGQWHILSVTTFPIVLHSIYVSNPNPVAVRVEIEPLYPARGRILKFAGIFGNEVSGLTFWPPIGPFDKGQVKVKAFGTNADQDVLIALQYTEIEELGEWRG
jgi:hypothetical protein